MAILQPNNAQHHSICGRIRLAAEFILLVLTLIVIYPVFGQDAANDPSLDTRKRLSTELHKKRNERAMLNRILGSLNIVDSAYIVHFPTWIIGDQDIRERVQKVFRNRLKFPSRDSDLVVITNPSKTEIEELSIGSVSMGREETRLFLSDNLRRTILSNDYARSDAPPEFEPKRKLDLNPEPKSVFVEGSLFGGSIHFANGWGAEAKIGNDRLGYPFWSTGSAQLSLMIDQLKIGAIIPLNVGLEKSDIVGPLSIQGRKLNGAGGFSAEYSHSFMYGDLNLSLISSNLTSTDSSTQFTSLTNAYYVRSMVQAVYTQDLAAIDDEHFFTFSVGVGYHQIGRGVVQSNNDIATPDKYNYYSPIFKINYLRQGAHTYGFEVQSYSSTVLISTWIEIVKDFIYTDLKYSVPVFRGPEPWENNYFIMLSPRIRLSF